MDTFPCPTCSKPCAFKNGIMCTLTKCIKDSKPDPNNPYGGIEDFLNAFNLKGNPGSKK